MLKNKPTIAFISTYPPRECGIATFTEDLRHSIQKLYGKAISCKVVALNLSPLDHYIFPAEVKWEITQNNKEEYSGLAQQFNSDPSINAIVIQHEYGIYGGEAGENILAFIEECTKPIILTLHTILPEPNKKHYSVTATIIRNVNYIVVLTENAKSLLTDLYPEAQNKICVIPHGIHYTPFSTTLKAKKRLKLKNFTTLSTFGLLSRGKGIEHMIKALPALIEQFPSILYLVLGETHPAVRREEGEKYRLELAQLVTDLNIKKHVKFYDQYLDLADLIQFLKATDIYISTSINPNQAVSGTLSYALGCGRAVVSTSFAQAREIITKENGRLVPMENSAAYTLAITEILADKELKEKMYNNAYETTRFMLWENVASEYTALLKPFILPHIDLTHLHRMSDHFGLFQFSHLNKPNKKFGYTLDDNARALIVCSRMINKKHKQKEVILDLTKYLNFLEFCQQEGGRFTNYIEYHSQKITEQNNAEDISEATARTIWALSEVMQNSAVPSQFRKKAKSIFRKALPNLKPSKHLRYNAFLIKALVQIENCSSSQFELSQLIVKLTSFLAKSLKQNASKEWFWFENQLSYNNAVLPESLIIGGTFLKNKKYVDLGISALQFLIDTTFVDQKYHPIGQAEWYKQDGVRSYYDQQPEDPAAMILALATAYKVTSKKEYKRLIHICFSWFLGNNTPQQSMYNHKTGGCYDGLHPHRPNLNQGAESLVSYLLSRITVTQIEL